MLICLFRVYSKFGVAKSVNRSGVLSLFWVDLALFAFMNHVAVWLGWVQGIHMNFC